MNKQTFTLTDYICVNGACPNKDEYRKVLPILKTKNNCLFSYLREPEQSLLTKYLISNDSPDANLHRNLTKKSED